MSGKKILTLCFIHQPPRILLGMKKRGFGAGRWNGFGGKVESGETIEEAARREVSEEVGLTLKDLHSCGVIDFEFEDDPDILEVHLFRATEFQGEPKETEEMRPEWFPETHLPYEMMWVDDRHWMPLFLAGKTFRAKFFFKDQQTLLRHEILETDTLV